MTHPDHWFTAYFHPGCRRLGPSKPERLLRRTGFFGLTDLKTSLQDADHLGHIPLVTFQRGNEPRQSFDTDRVPLFDAPGHQFGKVLPYDVEYISVRIYHHILPGWEQTSVVVMVKDGKSISYIIFFYTEGISILSHSV